MFPTSVCTRLFTPQPCVRCHALLTQLAAILANPNTAVGFSGGIGNMTSSVDVMPPPPLPQSALGSARAPAVTSSSLSAEAVLEAPLPLELTSCLRPGTVMEAVG